MDENNQPTIKKQAVRIFDYLQQVVKLRTRIVNDLNNFTDTLWLAEIPREKGCYCSIWNTEKEDSDGVWVEIKKPALNKSPMPPNICIPWVDLESIQIFDKEPVLRDKIIENITPTNEENLPEPKILDISNSPDVIAAWKDYLEKKWRPWSSAYGPIKKVQDIYTKLFSMYHQQKSLSETYEIVLGLGLLNYKTSKGVLIFRHILVAHADLIFEPNRGTITLKSNPLNEKLEFEIEMLPAEQQPSVEAMHHLEGTLESIDDALDPLVIHPLLKTWTNCFNSKAVYHPEITPEQRNNLEEHPEVIFAPALILRERGKMGILKFLKKIGTQLKQEDKKDIPRGIKTLITAEQSTPNNQHTSLDGEVGLSGNLLPKDIYFPLPYNEEQLKIIKSLDSNHGILVQGPPGTGKSHTIANLICHLLATNKKILITSQTARALKVLHGMLPAQLQPLCVSVLGNKPQDLSALESAVNKITSQNNNWDRDRNLRRIKAFESELLTLRKSFETVKVCLRELREREIYRHAIVDGKFEGTAQELATQIRNLEKKHGWIPDEIKMDTIAPLSQLEFESFITTSRKYPSHLRDEIAQTRVSCCDILKPEDFVKLVEQEQKYKERDSQISSNIELRIIYDKLKNTPALKRQAFLSALRNLEKARDEACRRPLPWLELAVDSILGDQDQPLRDLFSITDIHMTNLRETALFVDKNSFFVSDNLDLQKVKADAEDLLSFLQSGKKLGWGIFRPEIYKRVKYLTSEILVNGRPCNDVANLEAIIKYCYCETILKKLATLWKDKINPPEGTCSHRVAIYYEQLEALKIILAIEEPLATCKSTLGDIQVITALSWHDRNQIKQIILVLEDTFLVDEWRGIQETLNKLSLRLKAVSTKIDSHSLNKDLLDCLEKRDWSGWGKYYDKLQSLEYSQKELELVNGIYIKLQERAPSLADLIWENSYDESIQESPDLFEKAWEWSRANSWLKDYESKHDEYQLQRDYEDFDKKINHALAELASEKAWFNCLDSMSEYHRQNLMAWSHTIKKIGKGTGKHAERYRKEAEGYMNVCREAIPAWIMPMYRVFESVNPEAEIFDVVIIDEASQSGPEALSLFYIAKACIVVGDDQQISPVDIGTDPTEVEKLIDLYLSDIPLRRTFGVQSSLFSHAKIRFRTPIVLREHFRCVPEIIQFSNDLCYAPLGVSLIPLRSCPPIRLTPVCPIYVKEGFRKGEGNRAANIPEAERIVEQIVNCCKDPKYANKSMGIIVLQGHTQDQIIKKMVIEQLGADEIEKREMMFGDPYDFQGDERDIIFLSMVAAPNERIGALSREPDRRRFNVAFSRARDQIWLYYSATLNDLSQNDFRYHLLSYCLKPSRTQEEVDDKIFDSNFEKNVYKIVCDRGYKVIPQFKAAEYRIDLVVEGMKSRLAIECDGDEWHGPEQYEQDQFRQRVLERVGWRFWRLRGSTFYRDPEQALDSLWQVLNELSIYPKGYTPPLLQPLKNITVDTQLDAPESQFNLRFTSDPTQNLAEPKSSDNFSEANADIELIDTPKSSEINAIIESKDKIFVDAILELLHESTQGKDLIADKVLRKLGYAYRGQTREKLRKKIIRLLTDMRRVGLIEEYETDKRIRIRLRYLGDTSQSMIM